MSEVVIGVLAVIVSAVAVLAVLGAPFAVLQWVFPLFIAVCGAVFILEVVRGRSN